MSCVAPDQSVFWLFRPACSGLLGQAASDDLAVLALIRRYEVAEFQPLGSIIAPSLEAACDLSVVREGGARARLGDVFVAGGQAFLLNPAGVFQIPGLGDRLSLHAALSSQIKLKDLL